MEQENQPPQFTFLSLITRSIAGLVGGILGSVVLLIIYILSVSIVSPVLNPVTVGSAVESSEISPLFIFILMGMVFASTLAANIVTPLLISLTQSGKYKRVTTSLFQIFIINIVVFVILAPIYLFSQGLGFEFMSYAAGLQIAFSVLASALVFEIIANYKYALLGVYSTIFAVLLAIALNIMVYTVAGNATILLFIALPLLWGGVGFMFGVVGMIYQWVVRTWGVDYLSTFQDYTKDYGIAEATQEAQQEAIEAAAPPPVDTEGVDFLRQDETPPSQTPPSQTPPQTPPEPPTQTPQQ